MLCTPTDTRTYDHTCERRSLTLMPRPKVTSVAGPSSTPIQRLRLAPVRRSRHTPLNMDESETKTTTNQNKIASAFKDEYNEYVRFTSSKYSDEKQLCILNVEKWIMIGNNTDEIIKEFFHSLLLRYQIGLEESLKGGDFFFWSYRWIMLQV